ncbi:MAG: GGDEF domain-containing protein [Lachnospiraceae bacterium]|nr:GGDEF domain-containing protein [Lachnospiraceae bacterium]
MKNRLCSENFGVFFDRLEELGATLDEIMFRTRDNMPLIAEDIKLGKMIVEFVSPPTPVESTGREESMIVYVSPEGFDTEELKYDFPTGNGGGVHFSVSAVKGYTWDADEKEDMFFLCRMLMMICGRARLSDIMAQSVSRDMETGLINSNGYVMAGNCMFREGVLHNYTAMYLNLKNFKYVNKQIGNQNANEVIKAYAIALAKRIKEGEVAARLGGDNFALLIRKERKEEVLKLLEGISVEVNLSGMLHSFLIESRIGMYDIQPGENMHPVMNCISLAINAARKSKGLNVVEFNQEILEKINHEQEISADFPKAIENREFVVYYQPKVNLDTCELCGGEALVRWIKNGKVVPPADFIPLFERDGSVCRLDFYVLDQVCRDIKAWKQQGIEPVTISVNFSKTHLHNPKVAEEILAVIGAYGIESKYIEIELTEMSDYSDYLALKTLVSKMKSHGIKTSIDDFGTGFSSLNLLTDFMFDIVKLDKSFLDNIEKHNSGTDEIVVRNIVKMVSELKMKAIAEGVETEEQARFLKNIDCRLVQGYLFDKPLPVEDFVGRLQNRKYENDV